MTSGGSRSRSGPAADPNALRRDRADDKGWTTLPAEGFAGPVPSWPFDTLEPNEAELWAILWAKPQAFMWSKLDLRFQIAAYVRTFLEANTPGAVNGLKTAALRMEAELGVNVIGLSALRWRFSEDEVAGRRAAPTLARVTSVKARLSAAKGA